MKEVVSAVRWRQFPALQWIPAGVLRARTWYTRENPQFMLDVKVPWSPPTPWSPTEVIPLDAEEMGVRAVCRLITNSIHLLTNHTSTSILCGVPGP